MAERKQLTLLYSFNENWIGGTYYVLNIIKALNMLKDEIKPVIHILYHKDSTLEPVNAIGYPYLQFVEANLALSMAGKLINKISKRLVRKSICKISLPGKQIANLYPCTVLINTINVRNPVYWIADFQEHHLPQFFSQSEIKVRNINNWEIANTGQPIIFSSRNALSDFRKFYPGATNNLAVIPFVSLIGDQYKQLDYAAIAAKYKLPEVYFASPNQFWAHKNHIVVLKAIKLLKQQHIKVNVVFTGKEHDYRNPGYFDQLKQYVAEHKLEDCVSFLGFIDRNEQLLIMKKAVAIIQPSLFEGWSTVVEDAKALNQYIILSNIDLHREQIHQNCTFFNPKDPQDLVDKLKTFINSSITPMPFDYNKEIQQFALNILGIIKE